LPITTIEDIYSEFSSVNIYEPDSIIGFYEKNAIFFNNIKQFKDADELIMYIEIVCRYATAIKDKGRYNLAIDFLEKHQVFIDQERKRLNISDTDNFYYNGLSLIKGVAYYNLKDYKTSTPIFKKLVLLDNQSDLYAEWYQYSLYGQRRWISNVILIISMALIAIGIVFSKAIKSPIIKIQMDSIGILGILGTSIYDYYTKRSFRKKKNSRI
jgi:tetratricopeptide (TPR) repeat protein